MLNTWPLVGLILGSAFLGAVTWEAGMALVVLS
jgi:hypothetical protein